MASPLSGLCSASFISLQPFLSFFYRRIKHSLLPALSLARSWDLPNNGWLCPRSDKKPQSKKPQSLFLSSVFFPPTLSPLTAFKLSLQHIIIITEDGGEEIREKRRTGEKKGGRTRREGVWKKYGCQRKREVEELLLLDGIGWVGGAQREQQC